MADTKKQFILQILIFCLYTITLIALAIIVNYFEGTSIWSFWAVKLSDLAIVQKAYFNYIFASCLVCGFISQVLYYYQVMKLPATQEEKEAN